MLSSRYIQETIVYIKNIIRELMIDWIKGAQVASGKPTEFGHDKSQQRHLAIHARHHSYYYTCEQHII
jgi:hypothetical protein